MNRKNLIDFFFLLCLIASPVVAIVAKEGGYPFVVYVRLAFQPEHLAGTLAGMCGQLLIIIGAPFLLAYVLSRHNKPTFRAWFIPAWLLIGTFLILGSR